MRWWWWWRRKRKKRRSWWDVSQSEVGSNSGSVLTCWCACDKKENKIKISCSTAQHRWWWRREHVELNRQNQLNQLTWMLRVLSTTVQLRGKSESQAKIKTEHRPTADTCRVSASKSESEQANEEERRGKELKGKGTESESKAMSLLMCMFFCLSV